MESYRISPIFVVHGAGFFERCSFPKVIWTFSFLKCEYPNYDSILQNEELLEYSKELLSWFVKNTAHFYGPYFTVYNVHNLIHLHDVNCPKMSLFDMSAFAFENYMQTLKHYICKSPELVVQVVNRRCEIDETNSVKVKKDSSTKLSVNERDRCFLIKGSFIFGDEIEDNNMLYCRILPITKCESLF